jgi:hypothetical protein
MCLTPVQSHPVNDDAHGTENLVSDRQFAVSSAPSYEAHQMRVAMVGDCVSICKGPSLVHILLLAQVKSAFDLFEFAGGGTLAKKQVVVIEGSVSPADFPSCSIQHSRAIAPVIFEMGLKYGTHSG